MARPSRICAALVAAVLGAAFGTGLAGCGSEGSDAAGGARATADETPSSAASAAEGDWLLRFTTAEGPDGERSRSVYVRYNPTTGEASARSLPVVLASDASEDEQVLLVNADHTLAVPDTAVPAAERRSGRLTLYSVTDQTTRTLDVRTLTGKPDLQAVAWAFDPTDADLLRVVDSHHVVWKVDLAAPSATQERTLPSRPGWIYGNGFDKTTGEPYIESIDSDRTEPAGNGDSDVRPVQREGGQLVRYDGAALDGLPQPPCGFAGGFAFDGGLVWLFCADTPSIAAYQAHPGGASWHAYGMPSPKVVPADAAELTFALPPVA
jgi:hypothetical protein